METERAALDTAIAELKGELAENAVVVAEPARNAA